MISISKNDPILKIEGLKTQVNFPRVSNSLVTLLGSYEEALIVQQLHSWKIQGEGVLLDGYYWFDKPLREWTELFPYISQWQIRNHMKSLIAREVLERKQLHKELYGHNYAPENRTYYYRLNYEGLHKLAEEFG